jgi:phage terminase small subunit
MAIIEEQGESMVLQGKDGEYVQTRPEVRVAHELSMELDKGAQAFGLDPSSRTRLSPMGGEAKDDLAEYLNARKSG